MEMMMKLPIFLTIFSTAACQFQFQDNFQSFRPSPQDTSSTNLDFTQYNPNDFIINLRPPFEQLQQAPPRQQSSPPNNQNRPVAPYPAYGYPYPAPRPPTRPPTRPPVQNYPYPPAIYPPPQMRPPTQKPLFTPAQVSFPAESQAQLDAYNKALREEAEQFQNQQQQQQQTQFFTSGFSGPGKSFVDVKFGGNDGYRYQWDA